MALDVVLIGCYPIVHWIADSTSKHHHGGHEDKTGQIAPALSLLSAALSPHKERGGIIGVWNGVPGGLIGGIATMLVVKAFAGLTWGYVHTHLRLVGFCPPVPHRTVLPT